MEFRKGLDMLNRAFNVIVLAGLCVVLGIAGCAPQAELALKFNPNDSSVYKVISSNSTNFKFEMPSSNKFSEKLSSMDIEITFLQEIESVDAAGVAKANITIQGLKIKQIKEGNENYNYDSNNPADAKLSANALIGKSYKISIDPKGIVTAVDAKKISAAVKGGGALNIKGIVSEATIKRRHEIVTLSSLEKAQVAVGDTWSTQETPPFKMLSSKPFEKIYTLDKIESGAGGQVAVVSMNAIPAGSAQANPVSMMTSMAPGLSMDSEDSYTGGMTLDVETGTLLSHEQILKVATIATDTRSTDKAPDVLTITQIFTDKAEKIK
jgi:hypothetical protein